MGGWVSDKWTMRGRVMDDERGGDRGMRGGGG